MQNVHIGMGVSVHRIHANMYIAMPNRNYTSL